MTSMCSRTAGQLEVAYTEGGPPKGPVVLLLHGWPDDSTTWDDVVAPLHDAGLRTIVPTLRGFGETRFLHAAMPRTGDSGILAMDAIALMDSLDIHQFMVVGHDWGSNIAEALAVAWPGRVQRIAMLSTPPRMGGIPTPPFWHAQRQWYHWFMATERGAEAVRADRRGFAHLHWENWAPAGWFDEETFNRVAKSWNNPDWVDVTLHSYRARWGEAAPDPLSSWVNDKVKSTHSLSLPAIYIQGSEDGVNPPAAAKKVPCKFSGPFKYIELAGAGHFPQREAPLQVSRHLIKLLTEKP